MPYSIRRAMSGKPNIKEWYTHVREGNYEEPVKFLTQERAQQVANEWGGSAEVVEVIFGAGETEADISNN